jgi:uncharacterized membrane protein YfcA
MFQVEPMLASSYSLFVVGLAALVGTFRYSRARLVQFRTAFAFGVPSVIGVVTARRWVLPNIPASIGSVGQVEVTRDLLILVLFAALMVAAGVAMLRSRPNEGAASDDQSHRDLPRWLRVMLVGIEGLVVGLITGLVGAGGGFLIVPALVLFLRLPIRVAIGTSLAIIAAKSLIGFAADTDLWPAVDGPFLTRFTAAAVAGMIVGVVLNHRVPTQRLRVGFGWFVLVLGIFILFKELGMRS